MNARILALPMALFAGLALLHGAEDWRELYQASIVKAQNTDVSGAIQDLTEALAINPDAYPAANYRGQLKQCLRDYKARGFAKMQMGDGAAAISDFDQSLRRNANNVETINNRAIAKRSLSDLAGALLDFDRAIELRPKQANLFNNRGLAYLQQGDLNAAFADLNRAIALSPRMALYFNSRGLVKRNRGDLNGAIDDSTKALTLDPKLAFACVDRAETYMEKGDFTKAREDVNRALELEPRNEEFRKSLGKLNAMVAGTWKEPAEPTPVPLELIDGDP